MKPEFFSKGLVLLNALSRIQLLDGGSACAQPGANYAKG
jgi:hypothetical protein